jgi:hypothetical protein
MSQYYGAAVVALAADRAKDDADGFLGFRTQALQSPM